VLLVIARPGGRDDVPFRSVASRLVRGGAEQMEGLDLDVLRPATFKRLAEVLRAARDAGRPYHVVHFDGHGTYADLEDYGFTAANGGDYGRSSDPWVSWAPNGDLWSISLSVDQTTPRSAILAARMRHGASTWKDIMRAYMEVGYDGIFSVENEDPILSGEVGVERALYVLKNVREELLTEPQLA